ncbi:MAG: tetratricopeptide repeat protein [Spirochaetes bacterium]|nr:tetratricopeptide repeat protein [Spirochaetota bacterium]
MSPLRSTGIPFIIILAFISAAWLDPYRDAVSSGNNEFREKKYNGAKRYYRKAERYAPGQEDRKKLSFNQGDAEYMLEDYEGAVSDFRRALQSEDRDVQKRALFNIGNARMKEGNYREAVEAYINALKIDPDYLPAKKNLEHLLKKKDNKNQDDKNEGKDGNRGQQGQNKEKKDQKKDAGKKGGKGERNDPGAGTRDRTRGGQGMNPEQIRNILRSMEKSPVRRQKGSSDERRSLEKNW